METCGREELNTFIDEIDELIDQIEVYGASSETIMIDLRSRRRDWTGFMIDGVWLVHRLVDNDQTLETITKSLIEIKDFASHFETHKDWCIKCQEGIEDCTCRNDVDWCYDCDEDEDYCTC